jgi:hypothetical protein
VDKKEPGVAPAKPTTFQVPCKAPFGVSTSRYGSMSLDHDIATSAEWLTECNARIDGATLGDSTRNRVSAALLHLSLEHHGAIQLLASNKPHPHYGSAFALLRPQFEGYIRGVWFHRCASEQELDKFIKNAEPPRIDELIQAIETVPDYEEGLLKSTKQKVWKIMCGYTHGGSVQVASRNSATEITGHYTDEQVRELIDLACSITLPVSVAFAQLLDNNTMANEFLSTYRRLFP